MAGNKTRVQVRGTIGKSVLFPTAAAVGAAILGVNVQLPNGTVPTLAQLAATLAGTNTGNIIPPGGSPVVIFQNIQNVPASVLNPARFVPPEEDDGEDTYHRAVPGPQGQRGATGFSVNLTPDDAEDASIVPGPQGTRGQPGVSLVMNMPSEDPDDAPIVPGPPGAPGIQGVPGTAGVSTGPQLWIPQDESEEAPQFAIPGSVGPRGLQGFPIPLYGDDVDDVLQIPGPVGPQGIQGLPGAGSAGTGPVRIIFDEEPEEFIHFQSTLPTPASGVSTVSGTISQIVVTPTTGAVVVSLAANIAVPAPGSGTAVDISGAGNFNALVVRGSSTAGQSFGLRILAGTNASDVAIQATNQAGTASFFTILGSGSGNLGPTNSLGVSWNAAGNFILAAPASGTSLAVDGANGASAFTVQDSLIPKIGFLVGAAERFFLQYTDATSTTRLDSDGALQLAANNTTAITIGTAGNITVALPASGDALTINQVTGSEGLRVACTAATGAIIARNNTNGFQLEIGNVAGGVYIDASNTGLILSTQGSANPRLTIGTNGAVAINAPSAAVATLTLTGPNGANTLVVQASTLANNSFGHIISAGTSASDYALRVLNAANSQEFWRIYGDGGLSSGPASGGSQGLGTINATGYFLNGAAFSVTQFTSAASVAQTWTSTTTLVAIAGMSVTVTATGTYEVEGYMSMSQAAAGGAVFKMDMGGGSATLANSSISIQGTASVSIVNATTTLPSVAVPISGFTTSAATPNQIFVKGTVRVTATGTVIFRGAQNASSTTTITLAIGSYLRLTKVA